MTLHYLKLNIKFCDAVYKGKKTFEVRYNDRNFKTGDHIKFIPVDGNSCKLIVSHPIKDKEYEIKYVLKGGEWGILGGYVVFSIEEVK